jgi:hypothetical protein
MTSRTLRRRLFWTWVASVLLILALIGTVLRVAELIGSATRRPARKGSARLSEVRMRAQT